MKIYQVSHYYDTDGGFGDAVGNTSVIATFTKESDAKAFVKKYAKPHVYKTPYDRLECGELNITEIEVLDSLVDFDENEVKYFWWLYNDVVEDDEEDDKEDDEDDEEKMNQWLGRGR